MSSPIFLTGREAASYQWNTYQGNLIVKAVKAAASFVKGVLDRFSVSEADARQYVNRTDTQNTYARSILERQIRVIDAINNTGATLHTYSADGQSAAAPANTASRSDVVGGQSAAAPASTASRSDVVGGQSAAAPASTASRSDVVGGQSSVVPTGATSRPSDTGFQGTPLATSRPSDAGVQRAKARIETTSHPSSGFPSKAYSTTLPARPYDADAPITPRVSEAPGLQASSVDGVPVEKIGMDVKQILPLLQMLKMDKTTQTKVIDWFGKVQGLSEKVESGRMSEEAALQMAPELAREFISFLPIRDHLKAGLQDFVLDLVSMIKDGKEPDANSGFEILRKYGKLFYGVSRDLLDAVSRSLELGQSEQAILKDTLTCVANIIDLLIRPENENRPEAELLQEIIMPQVLGLISTFPEDFRKPVLDLLMRVYAEGASPQPVQVGHPG